MLVDTYQQAKGSTMKLSNEVLEQLFDGNIRIEEVFHMQLVTCCDSLPDSFWGVFEDDHEGVLRAIGLDGVDTSEYGHLASRSELLDFLHNKGKTGVLIQFLTPCPQNLCFDSDGEFSSCSSSWGLATYRFAYGETFEEAVSDAIRVQDEYFEECVKRELARCSGALAN